MCKATLEPVLRTCETVKKKCHLEITNLVIPGQNDSEEEFRELTDFVADYLGKDTPLHFSRYFPRNRATFPPTPESTLIKAWKIARERLDYVYIGNIDADDKANTHCPSCKNLLVKRSGYSVQITEGLKRAGGKSTSACPFCGSTNNIQLR